MYSLTWSTMAEGEKWAKAVTSVAKAAGILKDAMDQLDEEAVRTHHKTVADAIKKLSTAHQSYVKVVSGDEGKKDATKEYEDIRLKNEELLVRAEQWLDVGQAGNGAVAANMEVSSTPSQPDMTAMLKQLQAQAAAMEQQRVMIEKQAAILAQYQSADLNRPRTADVSHHVVGEMSVDVLHEPENSHNQGSAASTSPRRSSVSSDTGRSASDVGLDRLAEALQRGFSIPQPELPVFDGNPLEFTKFFHCFETVIESKVVDDKTRLMYLIQQCRGEAKEAIDMCALLPSHEGYKQARDILLSRYGRKHHVARACVERIVAGPQIKANDPKALSRLALDMQRTSITLKATGYSGDVDNSETLKRLVRRLPTYLRQRWVDVSIDILEKDREPRFDDLAKFVDSKARAANSVYGLELAERAHDDVTMQSSNRNRGQHVRQPFEHQPRTTTLAAAAEPERLYRTRQCGACQGACVFLDRCNKFKSLSMQQRKQMVADQNRCINCLKTGHHVDGCLKDSFCRQDGCSTKHHYILHEQNETGVTCAASSTVSGCYLGIVPVQVECNGKTCYTYALLDDGSQKSLCTDRLLNVLGVEGTDVNFSVSSVTEVDVSYTGKQIDLFVKPVTGGDAVKIERCWTIPKLPANVECAP